ncbi:hypothetical protein [Burkholderia pseudomallei]|uniref:hypothetical protein n=1 Tax=Burkholderia pseudomallei TaxID=28450 RepID=UPI00050E11E4|nr:hypothetical protein [Burkholderia pseudomallei]KGD42623.1 hypothetical protein DO72_5160 [Burkholderia pseudomallei]
MPPNSLSNPFRESFSVARFGPRNVQYIARRDNLIETSACIRIRRKQQCRDTTSQSGRLRFVALLMRPKKTHHRSCQNVCGLDTGVT